MRYGLKVRRGRSKGIAWQTPLLGCVLMAVAMVARNGGFGGQTAKKMDAGRRLTGTTDYALDPYTNEATTWCAPGANETAKTFDFKLCKKATCPVEVPVDYINQSSPYYVKSQNRSSTSYISNYAVDINLATDFQTFAGNLNYSLARSGKVVGWDKFFPIAPIVGDNKGPYEWEAYKAMMLNDWHYNKDDIVQYTLATKAQYDSAPNAKWRMSDPTAEGRLTSAVIGRWFGPVGVRREFTADNRVVDVPKGIRHACDDDDWIACLQPPLEIRICKDGTKDCWKRCTSPDDCDSEFVKHDLVTKRKHIRICELPDPNYPEDPFTYDEKREGAIMFHVVIICFMFIGIAIVCDEFFEPALGEICEFLSLKDDVAGATFMAAGGSAPELFTSIMGVFVAQNDIGFGTIVGSAVFNVLFVIAMCAFVCPGLKLSFWPLVRDSSYYCFSILMLVAFIMDEKVYIYESCILFVMYLTYVGIMKWNEDMEVWVTRKIRESYDESTLASWRLATKRFVDSTTVSIFIYVCIVTNIVIVFIEPSTTEVPEGTVDGFKTANYFFCAVFISEFILKVTGHRFFGYWRDPMNAFDGILVIMIGVELAMAGASNAGGFRAIRAIRFFKVIRGLRIVRLYRLVKTKSMDASTQWVEGDWNRAFASKSPSFRSGIHVDTPGGGAKVVPLEPGLTTPSHASNEEIKPVEEPKEEEPEEEDDEDDDEPFNPFDFGDGSPIDYLVVGLSMPLRLGMFLTIPDCRRQSMKKLFPITFFMCIIWIAAYSYVMVWMAVQFGCVTGIPDPVMGLTLLAAGTSIPDALSSLAVAKKGHGDMAVSSSIGSNIFDILFGLAVPWMLGTAVSGECLTPVTIRSSSMAIMVLTLFIMVALMIMCIVFAGWKLTRKLGLMYLTLYILFVAESLLLEYKIIFAD
jgi:K+-dependent Na+/Ca+ exchanger-like protein